MSTLSSGAVEYVDCTYSEGVRLPPPTTKPLVGRRQRPVMLKDSLLVVEQYLDQQLSSQVTCNTQL